MNVMNTGAPSARLSQAGLTGQAEAARTGTETGEAGASPSEGDGHWQLGDLDWAGIDHARIAHDETLFYLLVSASFIETGSDTYTANLAAHYAAWPEVAAWLNERWEREELQHGAALRRYVETVWPSFDWQPAYDAFFAEYVKLCTADELEAHRTLEMVARCVVETGTTTYYHTLRELSPEPVLSDLLGRIRADEVRHYKHFLHYFKQLRQQQPVGRARVARVLYGRLAEMRSSDSDIALRHVWAHRGALFPRSEDGFEAISQRIYALVSTRLPAEQAVRMLLKPLLLPHWLDSRIEAPLVRLTRRVIGA